MDYGSQEDSALRELSPDVSTGNACPAVHPATCCLLISVCFPLRVWALCSSLQLPKE